jgi:hypothetical protein
LKIVSYCKVIYICCDVAMAKENIGPYCFHSEYVELHVSGIRYSKSVRMVSAVYGTQLDVVNKQTPWPLVHKRTIPTELPPLVDEI